ncbi:MAG TPA: histidine kinase [bacterium]|nr:histidine kinase [bacterium]
MIQTSKKTIPMAPVPGVLTEKPVGRVPSNRTWKDLFVIDFDRSFLLSSLKLLLALNPLWTFAVSAFFGGHSWASILFRWGWNFLEATFVCSLGLVVAWFYLVLERAWAKRVARTPPRHGTGWFLLLLAFLAPPGLYLALRIMVAGINFFYEGDPIVPQFKWEYYGQEIFWVWTLLLVCFVFKSWLDLRDTAQHHLLRAEALEKERLRALLTRLQDQMNPHFLFNTLNTVAALISQDPKKAEKMVVKLSGLLQGVLAAGRKTRHPLRQELDFCRDYLEIEQARFGKRLKVTFRVEKELELAAPLVPVLILQPLVENAVKHGLSSKAKGGQIWLSCGKEAGGLVIRVEDDGVGLGKSPYAGSGTALENGRKRLALEYGEAGSLRIGSRDPAGTEVELRLPLVYDENTHEGGRHAGPDR